MAVNVKIKRLHYFCEDETTCVDPFMPPDEAKRTTCSSGFAHTVAKTRGYFETSNIFTIEGIFDGSCHDSIVTVGFLSGSDGGNAKALTQLHPFLSRPGENHPTPLGLSQPAMPSATAPNKRTFFHSFIINSGKYGILLYGKLQGRRKRQKIMACVMGL
jgi:hypothetical protein